jgi:hypothetical protein
MVINTSRLKMCCDTLMKILRQRVADRAIPQILGEMGEKNLKLG